MKKNNTSRTILTFLILIGLSTAVFSAERQPPLATDPQPRGTSAYTDYKPQPPSRVTKEVLRVGGNESFISRCLLVLSRDGTSKNFETITGQDGLTFGITDFATNGGVEEFIKLLHERHPAEFQAAFGDHAKDLLSGSWIKANNGGGHGKAANNNGLIRFSWLRTGLDQILSNRHLYGFQLDNFQRGKVDPSLKEFQQRGFKYEFTLGSMIGIANSAGAGGMREYLAAAIKATPKETPDREWIISQRMLRSYVGGDPNPGPADGPYLAYAFGQQSKEPKGELGHRGRRVRELVKKFPPSQKRPFTELGKFALKADEI